MKPQPVKAKAFLFIVTACYCFHAPAQTIGTFSSVAPGTQAQTLVLPSTHTFQRIIKTGDPLSLGGTLGTNLDFTGYVPNAGSSVNGRLSISSESTPAEVAVLDVSFNSTTALWNTGAGGKVNFVTNDIGNVSRFCSGTVTPNNTIIVSEEDVTAGNANPGVDGYTDLGWLIEIDPVTGTVINQAGDNPVADKLWSVGRANHENAVIRNDNAVLYTGTDDPTFGYLYKFIPSAPGNFSSGTLYVLQTTAALGTGTWQAVANSTVADRNNTRTLAQTAGGYNFNGIEDVEIAADGKIYFAAKGEGKIYRFTDNGAGVTGLQVFAGNSSYPAITNYDVDGAGPLGTEAWGVGNDNLSFDGEGNLWVLQDGGRNHIWVISPSHTQVAPQVRLFAKTPAGSEPTGITFTPNNRYMFISFQHPSATNTTSQTDAAGVNVVFNTHTTVVIARIEHLGPFAILPVRFTAFNVLQTNAGAEIKWSVADAGHHQFFSVERSADGINFSEVHRNSDVLNPGLTYHFRFTDINLPESPVLYYRIKGCDINGSCHYTEVKKILFSPKGRIMQIYPKPATDQLNLVYNAITEGPGIITIMDINGKPICRETHTLVKGSQAFTINTEKINSGIYLLTVTDKNQNKTTDKFIRQ